MCAALLGPKASETGKNGEQMQSCRSLKLIAFIGKMCALMSSKGLHEAIVQ